MVFNNIFDFSRAGSQAGATTEEDITGFLPTAPVEQTTLPPHDPSKPVPTEWVQDPKVVRETSPAARGLFNFINTLTGDVAEAADSQQADNADPATTNVPAATTMNNGAQASDPAADKAVKMDADVSTAPTVTVPDSPGA